MVIGAGQAGLSSAYFLRKHGLDFVVLDGNDGPGGAWRHRWPTLAFRDVHGLHELPGLPLGAVDENRRASDVVADYFDRYERAWDLDVIRPAPVSAVRRVDGGLLVESTAGNFPARAVISATGTWTRPFWPHYPGQSSFLGRQLHAADYVGPSEFAGRHVIVVGGGTTAVQLVLELSTVATTTWVTRRPPVFREPPFTEDLGRRAVAMVDRRVRAGLPPISVVGVTGLMRTPEIGAALANGILDRKPMFDHITPDGVVWPDGRFERADVILWSTGFRAALDHLAPLKLREPGGGVRMDGTRVVAEPRLHLVGYGPSASTIGANRAGRTAVREIRELLVPSAA
ncbi:pyridine nucleotide-disulfide oxidoreductase [Labedaea rhizosphaerae]|uniref:Pyridine nucleotide-disulfide oxidoreductase n=1 Tax=Labedaea rhizosphaerae TaxID=598644 RepID=A0A4R6SBE1_LABRH|nr:pyridine nucleotide-disulfide oxidoreductase [Labedaea rhizosphaerae]